MHSDFRGLATSFKHIAEITANRMRKRNVRHNAFAKKRRLLRARAGAIEKLIGNHHIERRVFLLQRSDGGRRTDAFDAEQFHRVDIGAKRKLRRRETMAPPMTRQKRDALVFQSAQDEAI